MNTLKQEVGGKKAEELQPLIEERSVSVKEGQDKLPMLYWLPKLHKRQCKARFIAKLLYHY